MPAKVAYHASANRTTQGIGAQSLTDSCASILAPIRHQHRNTKFCGIWNTANVVPQSTHHLGIFDCIQRCKNRHSVDNIDKGIGSQMLNNRGRLRGFCTRNCSPQAASAQSTLYNSNGTLARRLSFLLLAGLVLTGCETAAKTGLFAIGAGVTARYAITPTSDIQQTFYLGVFDPIDQLPPTLYRVRVRGQGSFLNATKFASGWVKSEVIDSLGGAKFGANGNIETTGTQLDNKFPTGRRLMLFGPEGFREAPKGHRLVLVMGSNPQAFFGALDRALGTVASFTQSQGGQDVSHTLAEALLELSLERERLEGVTRK